MASKLPTYTDEDINLVKWTFMIKRVAPRPLRFVLEQELVGKQDQESLFDFFKRKRKKLKNLYEPDEKLLEDRSKCVEDLDITLLYKVIRHGNCKLAVGGDKGKWTAGNSHIESLITRVKDLRNELYHEDFPFSEKEFKARTEMLRKLLTDILTCAGSTYACNTSQMILEISKSIKEYQDTNVEDEELAKYRFDKQCERVRTEGKENTEKQYRDMKETVVDTVNHIIELSSPVDDIFSDMELKKSVGKEEKISYEEILDGLSYDTSDPLILVEGEAGVGKTTIVKKIISDWMNGTKSVKNLQSFDLVLHHECRNAFVKDYARLLEEKMPDIARDLKEGELRRAALNVRSMIILDGLDELNDASTVLFEEILELKRKCGLTVVVTSRPEKLQYLENKLKSANMDMKHISILGIPLNQRKAFVERYHQKLIEIEQKKGNVNTPAIEELISYVEDTQFRLFNVWRFPYNLTFLTILYVVKHIDLNKITTSPELYREILRLYYTRLVERFSHSKETKYLKKPEAEWKTQIFLHALAKQSIEGLMKNQINLQYEAYKRLEEVCIYLNVPADQMIGAFLKTVPSTSSQIVYGYPHKGIQDYLAAQYVWMLLSGEYQSAEIHKAIGDVFAALSNHSFSPHISHSIMRVFEGEIKRRKQSPFIGKSHAFDAVSTIKDSEILLAMNNVPENIIEKNSKYLQKMLQDKESSSSLETVNVKQTQKRQDLKNSSSKMEGENLQIASVEEANQSTVQESTIISDILRDIYTESYQVPVQSQTSQEQSIVTHESASKSDTKSGNVSGFEINKFQNMLLCVIGLFDTEGKKVQDEIKLEALKLLQETGVKDRNAWLNVLSNVKCDPFVASFIASQEGILEGEIEIDDASLFPYLSLMKSLENPPENAKNVRIQLDIKQFSEGKDLLCEMKRLHFEVNMVSITDANVDAYLTVLQELKGLLSSNHDISISIEKVSSNVLALLQQVNYLNVKVSNLHLETHFRNPSLCDLQCQTQINQIMKRCPVKVYTGSMFKGLVVSTSVRELYVSVGNEDSINTLNECLQSHTLDYLRVCVSADSNHLAMKPLPDLVSIYMVDVRDDNIQNVRLISKNLQPVTGEKKFFSILFPRCNIPIQHQLDLIHSFERMGIEAFCLSFPSSNAPQRQQQQLIREEAKKKLGCTVFWGRNLSGYSIDNW